MAFFSKTNAMINFLQKIVVVWAKNANFMWVFSYKIVTSVPGLILI
jgi:hypothetical protein